MSVVICEDCGQAFDIDVDDGSFSDEGDYLCENCSEKDNE